MGEVWSCPFGGVNSNPRAHMRTQGPENPSQFRVQATSALTDEGSESRGGVWSPQLGSKSKYEAGQHAWRRVLRTNLVI